jgi:hypothetical protein
MAIATAVGTDNELFKIVYPKEMISDMTDVSLLQSMVPFATESKTGEKYRVPVALTYEAGVTYLASDAATAINTAISAVEKQAEVSGCQIFINGAVTKKAIAASLTSKQAFKRATAHKVTSMLESGKERLEWELLYGGDLRGLGVVTANTADGVVTTATLTFSQASFPQGLWSGKTGTLVDAYDATGVTKRNAADMTVVTADVSPTVRTLTITGTAADLDAIVATDAIWFKGQKGQQCSGLYSITTSATTLFGISQTSYDMFKGNSFAVGGVALSYLKVMGGLSQAVARGLRGKCTLMVSPLAWKDLANDVKELQQFQDGSQVKKADLGPEGEAIMIHYQRGVVKVMSHPLVRIGDGLLFQDDVLERIGSTDLTFDEEGKGEYFFEVPNTNYKAIKLFSDQALFTGKPNRLLYFSGIVPTA